MMLSLMRTAFSSTSRGCAMRTVSRPCVVRSVLPPRCHAPSLLQTARACSSTPDGGAAEEKPKVLYEGAKNKLVATLKTVSIANLGFALSSAPILHYITSMSGQSGKGIAMSSLLIFFGGGTTGMLTWATTTYVLQVRSIPGKEALLIDTPTITGGTKTTEVAWADVTRPLGYHPFATFEAQGSKYYLDELGEMFDDTFQEKLTNAINE